MKCVTADGWLIEAAAGVILWTPGRKWGCDNCGRLDNESSRGDHRNMSRPTPNLQYIDRTTFLRNYWAYFKSLESKVINSALIL